MAQRLTQQRQIYFGVESTEGVQAVGGGSLSSTGGPLLVSNLTITPDKAFHSRSFVGQMGGFTGKMGAQTNPALSFTVDLKGGGSAITPEMDQLLAVVLSPGADTSGTARAVAAGSTNTIVNLDVVTGIVPGVALAFESDSGPYEVGWVASVNGNAVTLTDALTFPPTAGKSVKGSLTYKPANTGHGSLSFQIYLDSTHRISLLGCKGSVKLDMPASGQPGTATFNFQAMSWLHESSVTRPDPTTYSTAVPPSPYLFKVGATSTDIKMLSWDLGQTIGRKMSQNSANGTISQLVTNRALKGSFQAHDVDDSQFSNWTSGQTIALAHQLGSSQNNIVAYQIRQAQRTKVGYGDDNGLTTDQVDFQGNIVSGADEVRVAFM